MILTIWYGTYYGRTYHQTCNIIHTLDKKCWSLRYSWSIAWWHCSNYIFILSLTPGFNGLGNDNCKTKWEPFNLWIDVTYIRGLKVFQTLKSQSILNGSFSWVSYGMFDENRQDCLLLITNLHLPRCQPTSCYALCLIFLVWCCQTWHSRSNDIHAIISRDHLTQSTTHRQSLVKINFFSNFDSNYPAWSKWTHS